MFAFAKRLLSFYSNVQKRPCKETLLNIYDQKWCSLSKYIMKVVNFVFFPRVFLIDLATCMF